MFFFQIVCSCSEFSEWSPSLINIFSRFLCEISSSYNNAAEVWSLAGRQAHGPESSSEGVGGALWSSERDRKKTKNIKHNGNVSLDEVIEMARIMRLRSMAKDLSGTVKEISGTCVSVGCTVDGNDPKDLQQEISDGDVEISRD